MDKCPQLRAVGIRHGFGDDWLGIGGLKGFVDGHHGQLKCLLLRALHHLRFPGFLADLVVLDRDPFRVQPGVLKELKVLLTIAGGRIVFDATKDPRAVNPARK